MLDALRSRPDFDFMTINDENRRGKVPWPDYLVTFAMTGDEQHCFAYGSPDGEPAVVRVDGYTLSIDEDDEPHIDWTFGWDNFVEWFDTQANWLPVSDAKMATWRAKTAG